MRKFIFVFLFIIAGLSYLFKIDELLVEKFSFVNDMKVLYINKIINFSTSVEKHFEQVNTITKLKTENNELKEYKILYETTQNQLNTLKEFLVNVDIPDNNPKIELVKVLSYMNFDDFTKVWLDKKINNDSILGLITDNYSAGIVVNKDGRAVGLLNGNKDCTYAVFIGEGKAPGIITASSKQDELEIKFIPIWADLKKGDEVITSGMDNIFYEGLKVGRIIEVTDLADMKVARVKPYANVLKKKYFYTYKNNPEYVNPIIENKDAKKEKGNAKNKE
ncbi:rod shape-determining protein MreC [Arcobacter venerupis]|uniref:Rod shape-determining protein MreC n=1 Tax=Arcobacter venerupis TaxID=1054033 RepID=A0AAE7E511_9BACT|nr:rod shape-determining protein MreC [Arcobacter venerupis]QKF68470.1 rod shape-determining protein MreC [Arcobacter venerupis]RWS48947.1 rod shape-determining protein MreC [Arcobacter venerupis]